MWPDTAPKVRCDSCNSSETTVIGLRSRVSCLLAQAHSVYAEIFPRALICMRSVCLECQTDPRVIRGLSVQLESRATAVVSHQADLWRIVVYRHSILIQCTPPSGL